MAQLMAAVDIGSARLIVVGLARLHSLMLHATHADLAHVLQSVNDAWSLSQPGSAAI